MAQFGWLDCPEDVRGQVERFSSETARLLGPGLAGVYLHGSLAMGCFNPTRSDIDLLVVTHDGMGVDTKRDVGKLLLELSGAPRPIEISFLLRDVLDRWEYPTPFDLHYGEDWRHMYETALASGSWRDWNTVVRKDPDLAAHITITNTRGVCLRGAPIAAVFPEVPSHDYLDSILRDVQEARDSIVDNPVYIILNLCRVLAYVTDKQICSKDEGGAWGIERLPEPHRSLVAQALAVYRGEMSDVSAGGEALLQFAAWMLLEIEHRRGGRR